MRIIPHLFAAWIFEAAVGAVGVAGAGHVSHGGFADGAKLGAKVVSQRIQSICVVICHCYILPKTIFIAY